MSRFEYNEHIDEELKLDVQLRAAIVRDVADPIADEVKRIALASAFDTGEYAQSIDVDSAPDGDAWARVNSRVIHAMYLEWGTVNMRAEAPMRRAADFVVGPSRRRGGN